MEGWVSGFFPEPPLDPDQNFPHLEPQVSSLILLLSDPQVEGLGQLSPGCVGTRLWEMGRRKEKTGKWRLEV